MPRRRNNPAPPKLLTDYPKKRCKNCPKFFYQTKPTREFCSNSCRMQFHRFGNSYGALKESLEKLMRQEAAPIVAKTFDAYVHGRTFKRAMADAGFIHKSQVTKRTKEERPKAMLAVIRLQAGALQNLNQRISSLERNALSQVLAQAIGDTFKAAAPSPAAPEHPAQTEQPPTTERTSSPTELCESNRKALEGVAVFQKARARAFPRRPS